MSLPIYLDYNATSPVWDSVFEAMRPYLTCHFGNPSSGHAYGRAAKEGVESARDQVSRLIGCDREELIFTSGGTESNNLAIQSVMLGAAAGAHLIISAFEHPAVAEVAGYLRELGYDVSEMPVTAEGVVQVSRLEAAIRPETRLVSVMLANNEIGTVQPIEEIAAICRSRGVLCHTDAAQCVGKIPVDVRTLGVDLLSVAGHKMYAPKGIGGLYVRKGVPLTKFVHGASHESGRRPGTENVASIVALGAASERIATGLPEAARRMGALRDRLEHELESALVERVAFHGRGARRLPNTSSVRFDGVDARRVLERAGEIAASTGAACHSADDVGSATLAAIGLTPRQARGTVRLSLGWDTTEEAIDRAAAALIAAYRELQAGEA